MFTSCCFCCEDGREMAPRVREREDGEISTLRCADLCCGSGMSEGRQSQVVLLDDYRLDILIKPKLYAGELLDMVASHFNLKEKEYFGLSYIDDTGHHNWLQLDRRVLEHDFPRKSSQSTLILFFRIKYFVESITHLRDIATVEAFYLQAQSLVFQGTFEVSSSQAFHLAALALQAAHGDYVNDEITRENLKKLPVIPTSTLLVHPSLSVCEKRVLEEYKTLLGVSRGNSIVSYMQIVEALPTYGVHYYEVKDKVGVPWWLGISYKGICQYDLADKKVPKKVFLWKQLENLYFRDRKVSIEVHDPKRPTCSRKTFGAGNICVYVWFAVNPPLTKCIWSMAISQHQFYLDRKHKTVQPVLRNLTDIATDLTHNHSRSKASANSTTLSRSGSTRSLPALKITGDLSMDLKAETIEMLVTLKARKEALEEAVHKKCEELKRLCLQEGELTGLLPPEMPLTPGEHIPLTIKRNSSDFSIKEKLSWKKKTKEEKELDELQLEFDIQNKIVTACGKLVNDPTVKKTVRRQRKLSFQKAQSKLKEMENKILSFRKRVERIKRAQLKKYSDDECSEDNLSRSTDETDDKVINASSHSIASHDSKGSFCDTTNSSPLTSTMNSPSSSSAPSSPIKCRQNRIIYRTPQEALESKSSDKQGYTPNSVYQTRTSYRTTQYPTLPTKLPTSYSAGAVLEYCANRRSVVSDAGARVLNLTSPYQNKFESTLDIDGSNLYSVPTQRTSQAFDTQDDILASLPSSQQDLGLISRHNSLDRRRRQSYYKQCYIENRRSSVATVSTVCSPSSDSEPLSYNPPSGVSSPTYEIHHPHYFHHQRQTRTSEYEGENSNTFYTSHTYSDGLNTYCGSACQSVHGDMRQSFSHSEHLCHHQEYHITTNPYPYADNTISPSSTEDDRCYLIPEVRDSGVCNAALELSNTHLDTYQSANAKIKNLRKDSNNRCQQSPTNHPIINQTSSKMSNVEISVVRYGQYQPYWEETKPYEISDFYKYSKKHRQQQSSSESRNTILPNFQSNMTSSSPNRSSSSGPALVSDRTRNVDYKHSQEEKPKSIPVNNGRNQFPDRYAKPPEKVKKTTLV